MVRIKTKKILITFLMSTFLFVGFFYLPKTQPKNVTTEPNIKTSAFQNEFFDTNLSKANKAEVMIPFASIQNIIDLQMGLSKTPEQRDLDMYNAILTLLNDNPGAAISIGTPEDLYNFSTAVSYNWKNPANFANYPYFRLIRLLLIQDYKLVSDIDYRTMGARKFNPIGIDSDLLIDSDPSIPGDQLPIIPFDGTFDGQGFTISNLYVADYNFITAVHSYEGNFLTAQRFSLIKSYSMFALIGEEGVIKNLRLINPSLELIDTPEEVTKTATFAGINKGKIYNVAVVDDKKNSAGASISGIRFTVQFESTKEYTAAGFVHTNEGEIYNSFFSSDNIVSAASRFRFQKRSPFVYHSAEGSVIKNVVFDAKINPESPISQALTLPVIQPAEVFRLTTNEIKTGVYDALPNNAIPINGSDLTTLFGESRSWHYYASDGYPELFSLNYNHDDAVFEINDEYDLLTFNKLHDYETQFLDKPYNEHNYILTDDIDMRNIKGYVTPEKPFRGVFSGGNSDYSISSTNNNYYIYNLEITKPALVDTFYYVGLFSVISGKVENLNLYNNKIILSNTGTNYGRIFRVGSVAGALVDRDLDEFGITNVISDTDIDLGTEAIGRAYVGGIVGIAEGEVTYTANLGNIYGNLHDFNNKTINAQFSLGGIVGSTTDNQLILTNSINKGSIKGVGLVLETSFQIAAGTTVTQRIGGIIGEVSQTSSTDHSLLYLTNEAIVDAGAFIGKSNGQVVQYVGGIFGELTGTPLTILKTIGNNPYFFNGRWENKGSIKGFFNNIYQKQYTAGIGVNRLSEYAELSYMTNSGSVEFLYFNYESHNQYIYYSATILDDTNSGMTLSRAYNATSYTFGETYFQDISDISATKIEIAPFFYSTNSKDKLLKYVDNRGDLFVGKESGTSKAEAVVVPFTTYIAGITLSNNVNYKNVTNSGNIDVVNINNSTAVDYGAVDVYVAGITYALPYSISNNQPYKMDNVLNKGNISVAGFYGETDIPSQTGTAAGSVTFSSTNFTSRNLYVAGVTNLNVGEIKNSFNTGNLTSTYTNGSTTVLDIKGTANTFVGGISTFNYNLIQDAANSGLISFTNIASGIAYAASSVDPDSSNARYGGLIYAYKGGLVLGGITAVVANTQANILSGIGQNVDIKAKVADTANNGDIYGKANEYVRSGGIVGVALGLEITAGTDNAQSSDTTKKYSYNSTQLQDPIALSTLSNGLNFGNIFAISNRINTSPSTMTTADRPGVFSSAGGVVAYGLFIMNRMLNHGIISATDVAGGIVGATYIIGSATASTEGNTIVPITTVNIDTAVHYGKVQMAKNSAYSGFTYENATSYSDSYFYISDRSGKLFPSGSSSTVVNSKPGFGGIFGRLQRGNYGMMQSTNFVKILNMDPDTDMVGRVDQTAVGSYVYYRFSLSDRDDTYYTARQNDTTPAALVGYSNNIRFTRLEIASSSSVSITVSGNWYNGYYVSSITVNQATGVQDTVYRRQVGIYLNGTTFTANQVRNNSWKLDLVKDTESNFTNRTQTYSGLNISAADYFSGLVNTGRTGTTTINNFTGTLLVGSSSNSTDKPIEVVTDLETTDQQYVPGTTQIFDQDFPLMQETEAKYIYWAYNPVLANRFRLSMIDASIVRPGLDIGDANPEYKKTGMYVLASTLGREAGAVLPQNIKVEALYGLNEASNSYIDLDNPGSTNLIQNTDLFNDYITMFQTRYNNQSSVLPRPPVVEDQPKISELILKDPLNTNPVLENGVMTETVVNGIVTERIITYTLSTNAFSSSNLNYIVDSASVSENAVIASNTLVAGDFSGFKTAYLGRTSNIMQGSYKPNLSASFESNVATMYLRVYSEIAASESSLFENNLYYTNYTIKVVRNTTPFNVSLTNLKLDGQSITALPTLTDSKYTVLQPMNSNGSIELLFTESAGLIEDDHKLSLHGIYLNKGDADEYMIDSSYYTILYYPKANNIFGFRVTFNEALMSGNYSIEFSYYINTQRFNVEVEKKASTSKQITSVTHQTFSSNLAGSQLFTPVTGNFITYTEFGNMFEGVLRDTDSTLTIDTIEYVGALDYVNQVQYYDFYLGVNRLMRLSVSNFTKITGASVKYQYNLSTGKIEYVFSYDIRSEAETNTSVLTHTVVERNPDSKLVYLNGNQQFGAIVNIARENILSLINVDFRFTESNLYNNISTTITNIEGTYASSDPLFTDKIAVSTSNNYVIQMTNQVPVGDYTFAFVLTREGVPCQLGTLKVSQNRGVSAYISDINFQLGSSVIISYPFIYEIDQLSGERITPSDYDTRIYFEGIDYNGANINNSVTAFRIDGEVSDIELSYYFPEVTLPLGAKIQRKTGDNAWSDNLFDNYTSEIVNQRKTVRYRVLSEQTVFDNPLKLQTDIDDDTIVYYDFTAEDVKYKLTLRFSLFYRMPNGTILPANQVPEIQNSAVLINIKNYNLLDGTYAVDETPTDIIYPYEGSIINQTEYIEGNNLINQATLFYFPNTLGNYVYSFGKNTYGAYNFRVVTPKYLGETETESYARDQVNGLRYDYNIYLTHNAVGGSQYPWNTDKYLLPNFDSSGEIVGKYFYIPGTNIELIREFAIVIEYYTVGDQWGLYDDYTSWDD